MHGQVHILRHNIFLNEMNKYVALLRGINVGGHKKVPMADLRQLLTELGLNSVKTYIQSGNVVFQSEEKETVSLEDLIRKGIQNHFGFEISVLVKTDKEVHDIFNNNPFSEEIKPSSYFIILHTVPDNNLVTETSKIQQDNEMFQIDNSCIYTYCSIGYGNAKCTTNFFERKLKVSATARNYRTMNKLLELLK